jgi:hypothetical protein
VAAAEALARRRRERRERRFFCAVYFVVLGAFLALTFLLIAHPWDSQ